MTEAERAQAIVYLEETRRAILDATSALTEAQWRYKPSPEEWSAAECVEHIAIVENRLLQRVKAGAAGPADPDEVLAEAAGKDEMIRKRVPRRGFKAKAPEMARPSHRFADASALLAYFDETRENTISYVRATGDPIRSKTFPHFVFGPLDGYQWILFMAAHAERHLNQLNEVKALPDFPASA
jgi:hypothetical protein